MEKSCFQLNIKLEYTKISTAVAKYSNFANQIILYWMTSFYLISSTLNWLNLYNYLSNSPQRSVSYQTIVNSRLFKISSGMIYIFYCSKQIIMSISICLYFYRSLHNKSQNVLLLIFYFRIHAVGRDWKNRQLYWSE